jgi:heme oxygenase (biliverdin-producing, ferredoxin)
MTAINIRQHTAEKHAEAENTDFMKAVFAGTLAPELWCDFTFQKILIYSNIETAANALGLLEDLPGISRTYWLYQDYLARATGINTHSRPTLEYQKYLMSISQNPEKILAHLYVWHMGDLHGGQMIQKVIPGEHASLKFESAPELIQTLRSKITPEVIPEILVAFDWAIGVLNAYRLTDLEQSI